MNAPLLPEHSQALDLSWGASGWAELPAIPGFDEQRKVCAIAVQRDGKLVACVSTARDRQSRYAVYRLTRNGTLDPRFGNNGWIAGNLLDDINGVTQAQAIALQWDADTQSESILLLGCRERYASPGKWELVVTRFGADGVTDVSFAYRGRILLREQDGEALVPDSGRILFRQARIFVTCSVRQGETSTVARIRCIGPNGGLDTEFAVNGALDLCHDGGEVTVCSLSVAPEGHLLVNGLLAHPDHAPCGFVARFTEQGQPDFSFGPSGYQVFEACELPASEHPRLPRQDVVDGQLADWHLLEPDQATLLAFNVQGSAGSVAMIARVDDNSHGPKRKSLMKFIRLFSTTVKRRAYSASLKVMKLARP